MKNWFPHLTQNLSTFRFWIFLTVYQYTKKIGECLQLASYRKLLKNDEGKKSQDLKIRQTTNLVPILINLQINRVNALTEFCWLRAIA